MKKKSKLGQFFGWLAIGAITLGVLIFLASHSLSFFRFTFSTQNQIYAWLGLLLTSGGVIGWLVVFENLAKSVMQKGIALIMMVIGLLGEMGTAIFDMQYSSSYSAGFQFAPEELNQMTMLVGALGAVTGLALIMFFAGDHILKAFKDDDGDGIPDFMDRVDNRTGKSFRPAEAMQMTVSKPFLHDNGKEPVVEKDPTSRPPQR